MCASLETLFLVFWLMAIKPLLMIFCRLATAYGLSNEAASVGEKRRRLRGLLRVRALQTRAAATGKARSPTVDSRCSLLSYTVTCTS